MVTSGPLKRYVEIESGIRPNLRFLQLIPIFNLESSLTSLRFLFLRVHTGKSKSCCHTLCRRRMNEV